MQPLIDPMGFIAPLVHEGKLLLHDLCYEDFGWDDLFCGEMLKRYERWCRKCDEVGEVIVPRCI